MYSTEPVIRQALGEDWYHLDRVVRRHYDLSPGEAAAVKMRGRMEEIDHSLVAKLFLIPARLFGALIPYKGRNIQAVVRNWTIPENNKAMFWHRTFRFPKNRLYIFSSRMEYIGDNEIIEYVRFGLGIRMRLTVSDGSLVFRSMCYQWHLWGLVIKIPTWLILGTAEIIETGRSDTEFEMDFQIRHPLFGRTFTYSGAFAIDE